MNRHGVTAALGAEDIKETPAKPAIPCPRCKLPLRADVEFCSHCGAKIGEHKPVPWWHLHRRMYDWTLAWAYRPSSSVALFVLSFAESSFFPIPPDVLLMPLVLGNRRKWFRYAFLCSLASVLGAVAGFLIGWLAWVHVGGFFHDHVPGFERDSVVLKDGKTVEGLLDRESVEVQSIISVVPKYPVVLGPGPPRYEEEDVQGVKIRPFTKVGKLYEEYKFWVVFLAGFTPLPFKVITITAGIFGTGDQVASPAMFFWVFLLAAVLSRSARFFLVAGLMRVFGPKITPFIEKYFNWLALLFAALLIGGFVVIKILAD